jgi:hypothetical protein
MVLGGDYASAAELVFLQTVDGSETVLALATGKPQWWPFIVICVVVSGIIGLILVEWRLSKRRSRLEVESAKRGDEVPSSVSAKNVATGEMSANNPTAQPPAQPKKEDKHDKPKTR